MSRVLPGLAEEVVAALDELWRRGIVRDQGLEGYDFSHDKLREVAYEAIGPARRRRLHLEVAEALESAYQDAIASLRHADDRMQFAFEAAGVGVWEFNPRTGVVVWSREIVGELDQRRRLLPAHVGWVAQVDDLGLVAEIELLQGHA